MKKIIINSTILIVLILFWIICLLLTNSNGFFTITKVSPIQYSDQDLNIDKNPFSGTFNASENNLSLLRIQFKDFPRTDYDNESIMQFGIKEEGASSWIVQNNYRTGIIKDNLTLPIGFPAQHESQGKNYLIQFKLVANASKNNIEISNKNTIISSYVFDKAYFLNSPFSASRFLFLKFVTKVTNFDALVQSIIYLMPLVIFLIYLARNNKYINKTLSIVALLLIFIDILLMPTDIYSLTFMITAAMIFTLIINRAVSFPYFLLIILIAFWLFAIMLNIEIWNSKLNIWTYTLMVYLFFELYLKTFKLKKKNFTYGNVFDPESQKFRYDLYNEVGLPSIMKNRVVLDLGCGFGPDAKNFTEYAKKVIGVDIDEHKSWKDLQSRKLRFVKSKSNRLPFKNNFFDVVFMKDLLHHVNDVDGSLKEIRRVTKKGGKIIIIEGNRYNPLFYILVTKMNGHEHFTATQFEMIVDKLSKKSTIIHYNIYPPFFMKGRIYSLVFYLVKFSNKIKLLQKLFSYNIAVNTK